MKIASSPSLGPAVRESREALGLSLTDMAAMIGISYNSLYRLECNQRAFDTAWMPLLPKPVRMAARSALIRDVTGLQV